jgi:uncharacterized protein (DUF1697 family)
MGSKHVKTIIALFRGINVGGRNKLPMRELVAVLEELGLTDVKTYIQSGNAVFHADDDVETEGLAVEIGGAIQEQHRFLPQVLLLKPTDLASSMAANPYPEAEADPKTLHLYFLASAPPAPDLESLTAIQGESERFCLEGTVFYLHAPDGIGRSKLAAKVEKAMGVPVTARNWRSVGKIMELAEEVDNGSA